MYSPSKCQSTGVTERILRRSYQISDVLTAVANIEGSRQKRNRWVPPLRPLPSLKVGRSHTPAFAEPHPAGVRCCKTTTNGHCLCHGYLEPFRPLQVSFWTVRRCRYIVSTDYSPKSNTFDGGFGFAAYLVLLQLGFCGCNNQQGGVGQYMEDVIVNQGRRMERSCLTVRRK